MGKIVNNVCQAAIIIDATVYLLGGMNFEQATISILLMIGSMVYSGNNQKK